MSSDERRRADVVVDERGSTLSVTVLAAHVPELRLRRGSVLSAPLVRTARTAVVTTPVPSTSGYQPVDYARGDGRLTVGGRCAPG